MLVSLSVCSDHLFCIRRVFFPKRYYVLYRLLPIRRRHRREAYEAIKDIPDVATGRQGRSRGGEIKRVSGLQSGSGENPRAKGSS